jgi:hypothetical protein
LASWGELIGLRPGSAIRVGGEDFEVERTIRFDQDDGYAWWEHRLSSDGTGRSLWLELPAERGEPVIVHESRETLAAPPEGAPEIDYAGERLKLAMSGRASYRSVERSAAAKSGQLVYHEYARGDHRVTYETRGPGTGWEVSEGRAIDPAAIEVVA